jgi:glutamate synthase (NADPH/NADH) small chain
MAKQKKGIHIGKLEQFIADFDAEMGLNIPVPPKEIKGKVAVIGSGPAGLTIAGDLAKLGFIVTVYESQAEPGGVLIYGIPEFRLSKEVVRREIEKIRQLGVVFKTGVVVGEHITVDQIFAEGYDAIFIGSGTSLPKSLGAPGEEMPGVFQAIYFLRTVVLTRNGALDRSEVPVALGDRVAVIGAGNVAMDAARTALRMGAARVTVVYHRTETDMSALQSEYQAAVEEGVEFLWLASTTRVLGDKHVEGLEYEVVEACDDKKLVRTGKINVLPVDKIMLAIGQRPAARIVSTTTGIEVNDNGYVITKERPYGMTTRRGVFAGGDVVHEPATVVLAMKEAKMVAQGIATYIEAVKLLEEC